MPCAFTPSRALQCAPIFAANHGQSPKAQTPKKRINHHHHLHHLPARQPVIFDTSECRLCGTCVDGFCLRELSCSAGLSELYGDGPTTTIVWSESSRPVRRRDVVSLFISPASCGTARMGRTGYNITWRARFHRHLGCSTSQDSSS